MKIAVISVVLFIACGSAQACNPSEIIEKGKTIAVKCLTPKPADATKAAAGGENCQIISCFLNEIGLMKDTALDVTKIKELVTGHPWFAAIPESIKTPASHMMGACMKEVESSKNICEMPEKTMKCFQSMAETIMKAIAAVA